uniref:Uncharacterized protein n=1 Tax=Anguilla anguilla TaxID=7936 RepID=A0A0E9S7C9_ANGAN
MSIVFLSSKNVLKCDIVMNVQCTTRFLEESYVLCFNNIVH